MVYAGFSGCNVFAQKHFYGGILDFVGLVRRYFRTWGIVVVVEYVVGCGHFS